MFVTSCIKIFTGDRLRHVARGGGGAERPVELRPVGLVDAGDEPAAGHGEGGAVSTKQC